ncbi:hypothetical protein [Haloarcula halophila]|uniref:hypothetical protein n=1 Tax=Haloarcula TaxID=2237 RepID=UPI0023E3A879|nr:hypothetical protein [Halomicroarcula sp. DFY41]
MASKSGVHTDVNAKVTHKVWTETANFVVNSTVGFLFDYAQARGLGTDRISNKREELESALYTYLNTRHLRRVSIEVYEEGAGKDDEAIERFDLTFDVKDPDNLSDDEIKKLQDRDFNQYRKDVMSQLQDLDSLPSNVNYRILIWCVSENDLGQPKPDVKGWSSTTARSTDHLSKKNLGDDEDGSAIRAGAVNADASLWIR